MKQVIDYIFHEKFSNLDKKNFRLTTNACWNFSLFALDNMLIKLSIDPVSFAPWKSCLKVNTFFSCA